MRVAIDARWNYHPGFDFYVYHLLKGVPAAAAERGIEVIAYESPVRPNKVCHPNLRNIEITSKCYSPAAQLELAYRARKDKIDLFHAPFYWIPFLLGCPVIATVHDLIPFLFPSYGFAHGELVKAGYRTSTRFAKHVLCTSDRTKQDILKILGVPAEKVTRVYNCLNTDFFSADAEPRETDYLSERYGIHLPYVLTFSASNWITKNIAGALRSIERARDLSPVPFQTVIAGSTAGIEQSGMKPELRNTVITGFVPSEDRPKLYRNAAVFITLSKYEGFGNLIAEAMACGTAAISSRGGSLPEIGGDGVLVCDENDLVAVAGAIVELLTSPTKRSQLVARALRRSKVFSLSSHADNMVNLYERLLRSVF